MILTPFFQLQLFNSFELPRFPPLFFLFHRKCVLSSFCVHTRVSVYVCHLLPDECFNSGFGCSFPFFSFFIFLKLFFLLKTSSPGNQLPSHYAGQAAAIFLKTALIFPHSPNRNSSGGLRRLESLPVWRTPWWR